MASSERKRQEKLARKAAKRKQHNEANRRFAGESGQAMSVIEQLALAAHAPVHECWVPEELFEGGIGSVVVSRALPNGNIVVSVFLLDVWCLGVKNAFLKVLNTHEYGDLREHIAARENLAPVEAPCARKLVEGAEAYAADLGFTPHPDYLISRRIFGDIDKNACPTEFQFGKDGKPYYASGPYETLAMAKRIVETLRQRCGPDGFDSLLILGGPPDLEDEEDLDGEYLAVDARSLEEGETKETGGNVTMWKQLADFAARLFSRQRVRQQDAEDLAEEEIAEEDLEEEEDEEEDDEQFARINALLGASRKRGFRAQVKVYFEHLRRTLVLPCEVKGIEDFRWEERYVLGPGNPKEYARLRKYQPSYRDHYQLLEIELGASSEWMLWPGEDIGARVRRQSDGKEFTLGLAELEAVDQNSPTHDLLHDYSVFFVNYQS
jgi:hypothetical protein